MTIDARHYCRGSDHHHHRRVTAAVIAVVAVIAAVARATTFEGGETATEPADDTVYQIEEVAALNSTAAAAGDYAYDDYDSSTADAAPFDGHYPAKDVPRVATSTAVPAATIIVQMPVTTTATITNIIAANTTAAVDSTTTFVTTTTSNTTSTTTSTTESNPPIQIASPLGYGVIAAAITTTPPSPLMSPNHSSPLQQCQWTPVFMSLALAAIIL